MQTCQSINIRPPPLTSVAHSKQPHLLRCILRGHTLFSSPICRSRCSSNQRKLCTHYLPGPSIHSLQRGKDKRLHIQEQTSLTIYAILEGGKGSKPGGVPQHMLCSSMCSTSSPMNQAPRDTSSLAYLCKIGLHNAVETSPVIILLFTHIRG